MTQAAELYAQMAHLILTRGRSAFGIGLGLMGHVDARTAGSIVFWIRVHRLVERRNKKIAADLMLALETLAGLRDSRPL